jgi:hypothetical protein
MAMWRALAESSAIATRYSHWRPTMTNHRFNPAAFAAAFAVTFALLLGVASMADQPVPDSYLATATTHQPV